MQYFPPCAIFPASAVLCCGGPTPIPTLLCSLARSLTHSLTRRRFHASTLSSLPAPSTHASAAPVQRPRPVAPKQKPANLSIQPTPIHPSIVFPSLLVGPLFLFLFLSYPALNFPATPRHKPCSPLARPSLLLRPYQRPARAQSCPHNLLVPHSQTLLTLGIYALFLVAGPYLESSLQLQLHLSHPARSPSYPRHRSRLSNVHIPLQIYSVRFCRVRDNLRVTSHLLHF